jgi:peptidoglycan/LPS O-acetylase OafA/YrhL
MSRVESILVALVVWAVSSGAMLFICVFSINKTIISAALALAATTLIGSAVAFATKHNKWGFAVAAIPALVLAGLLVMFIVIGYTEFYR